MKKLEDGLGVQIFDRSGHRALLTETGRLLLEEGRTVLDAAQTVERRVRSIGRGWEAELAIAVNDLVPIEPVLAAVGEFYAAGHPSRIRLLTEVPGGVWEALVAQRADVALTEVEGRGAVEIAHRPLGAVSFVFAVAPHHPLATAKQPIKVAAIRQHRVVVAADSARSGAPRSSGISMAADVLTVPNMQAKVAAQVAGLGCGFLPEALAAGPSGRGEPIALRVASPKPKLQLSVACRSAGHGPAAECFVDRCCGWM